MKALEERILSEGRAIGDDILKVDGFINHRLDVKLIDEMGEEAARLFEGSGANKILTAESSGISIACSAARAMGYLPVVFAKKATPSTMTDDFYAAKAMSFTKGTISMLRVSAEFLGPEDRVLIVDDFLARGGAAMALIDIVEQAGGRVVGVCAAIEKSYQGGADLIRSRGIPVRSLAVVKKIQDGKVFF